jgi:hypothetical protein
MAYIPLDKKTLKSENFKFSHYLTGNSGLFVGTVAIQQHLDQHPSPLDSPTQTLDVAGNITGYTGYFRELNVDHTAYIEDLFAHTLTVMGTKTIVNTTDLAVRDNVISLNSGELGNGVSLRYAGIEIDRGAVTSNALILWDEAKDLWTMGYSGNMCDIACISQVQAASGEYNTAVNIGPAFATGIYSGEVGKEFKFKKIMAGDNVTITGTDDVIGISVSAIGAGLIPDTRKVSAGSGLQHGGPLTSDITVDVGDGSGLYVTDNHVHVSGGEGVYVTEDAVHISGGSGICVTGDAVHVDKNVLFNLGMMKSGWVPTGVYDSGEFGMMAFDYQYLYLCVKGGEQVVAPITDSSSLLHVVSASGSAHHSTVQKKLGVSSISLDGDDWLAVADHSSLDMQGGDFTMETWIYLTSMPITTSVLFTKRNTWNGNAPFGIPVAPYEIFIYNNGAIGLAISCNANDPTPGWQSGSNSAAGTIQANTWHHIAFVRTNSNNRFTIYVNGAYAIHGQVAGAATQNTAPLVIGAGAADGTRPLTGFIDGVKITKGAALYTSTFTPPSTLWTESLGFGYSTVLLINSNAEYVLGDGIWRRTAISEWEC